jgi:hypothetical protein
MTRARSPREFRTLISDRSCSVRPTDESSEHTETQGIETLRKTALSLIRARGKLVRTGKMAGRYQLEHRGFTICYYTPFNRPVAPRMRTEWQRAWAELRPKFRYALQISQGAAECLSVAWDNEDEIFVLWFRQDYQNRWDIRFLRHAGGVQYVPFDE